MNVYTAQQMRLHEQMAVDAGTSFEQLMENAGQAAAADLLTRLPVAGRALVVCGKGNNGGDGLVMARVLQASGWQADIVFLLGKPLSVLAELNKTRLEGLAGIEFLNGHDVWDAQYNVIIDGVFGIGFNGRLPEHVAQYCKKLNEMTALKVALDMPTGLNGDNAEVDINTFKADMTYAFAAYKPAHLDNIAQQHCGEIVCLDIGIE